MSKRNRKNKSYNKNKRIHKDGNGNSVTYLEDGGTATFIPRGGNSLGGEIVIKRGYKEKSQDRLERIQRNKELYSSQILNPKKKKKSRKAEKDNAINDW